MRSVDGFPEKVKRGFEEFFSGKLPTNIMSVPWHQLKSMVDREESIKEARSKDRKFLSEMAGDKRYLEKLAGEFDSEGTKITKGLVQEVKKWPYLFCILGA